MEEIKEQFLTNYKIIQKVCGHYSHYNKKIPRLVWLQVMKIRKTRQPYDRCSEDKFYINSLKKSILVLNMPQFNEMKSEL